MCNPTQPVVPDLKSLIVLQNSLGIKFCILINLYFNYGYISEELSKNR